jgi:hypothetical protein
MKTFLLVAAVVFGYFFYTHFEEITASKERAAKVTELRASLWSANREGSTPYEIFQLAEELRFYIRDRGIVTSQDLGMSDEYEIKDWIGRLSLIGSMKQVAEDEKWIVALWQKHNTAKTRPTLSEL